MGPEPLSQGSPNLVFEGGGPAGSPPPKAVNAPSRAEGWQVKAPSAQLLAERWSNLNEENSAAPSFHVGLFFIAPPVGPSSASLSRACFLLAIFIGPLQVPYLQVEETFKEEGSPQIHV